MAVIQFDETEVRKTFAVLHPHFCEIRLIGNKYSASGYFDNADTLISELKRIHPKTDVSVYQTINYIKPACFSREQKNRFVEYPKVTTSDNDVEGYLYLVIDLDPVRPSDVSSTNEELEKAKQLGRTVYKYLKNCGWNDGVIAESGNGLHLLYPIQAEINKKPLLEKCLKALDMMFSTSEVEIDKKTFNPSRGGKLYGTYAIKGANTTERPHRLSRIIYVPKEIKPTDISYLQKLADTLPKEEPKPKNYSYSPQKEFDLQEWIYEHDIPVKKKMSWAGGTRYILKHCLFNEAHKGYDAAIIQTSDGKICYNCFHASCADNHWREVRLMYEPDAYDEKYIPENYSPNYKQEKPKPLVELTVEKDETEPIFYTTEQIRQKPFPKEEYIKTGITLIDRYIRGLEKGCVTVMSGLRASGKSSLISQIALNTIENGYKTALFSGELTPKNVFKWWTIQAAGKNKTYKNQYDKYVVGDDTAELISKWLNDKLYLYNNNYGNDFDRIVPQLIRVIEENKVDFIILDNLMSMNLSGIKAADKYDRQSVFVETLENMAKKYNVHIMFVAHPRKSQGFLRLEDISGSNDIPNRVDNALIVHRVGIDFKKKFAEMMGENFPQKTELFNASNIVEICKNRTDGIQDCFIPLYYEPETKRLKNSVGEYIHYSWEKNLSIYDNLSGFETILDESDFDKTIDDAAAKFTL